MFESYSLDPDADSLAGRVFGALGSHVREVVLAVVSVTAVLVVPFLLLGPDRAASTEPEGPVFDARDRIDERFVGSVWPVVLIAELDSADSSADRNAHLSVDPASDVLRAEPLRELLLAEQSLRSDPDLGPKLLRWFHVDAGRDVTGVLSLADLVDSELSDQGIGGLFGATDAQVKQAGARLIERFGVESSTLGLSQQTFQNSAGDWIVPGLVTMVLSDDTQLGFGNLSVVIGQGTESEEYSRAVRDVLRQAQGWTVQGVAIDVNLTSSEQGAVAGPFIGFTVLAALALVGLTFRSYWVLTVVSSGFLLLLIWLKAITNLIGLKDDLVLSLIVPVAMISFGVDYAFHALGRYREEREQGHSSKGAAVAGGAAVSGALILATMSDSVAFLANIFAGIESVVQFGIGAAIALVLAWLLLGVVVPLVVAEVEARVPPPATGRTSDVARLAAGLGAALLAMVSVLMLVFVLPWLGVLLSAVTIATTLVLPVMWRNRNREGPAVGEVPIANSGHGLAARVGRMVAAIATRPLIVVPLAVAFTGVASLFAVQVPARFDVEDFFSADTDFVQSLDLLDHHVGNRNGEPGSIYIEGDVTDPQVLVKIDARLQELNQADASLARDGDGVRFDTKGLFDVFDAAWDSPVMGQIVVAQTGVELTDSNGDTIPDTRDQIQALVAVASEIGVPIDQNRLALTPDDIAVRFDPAEGDRWSNDAMQVTVAIPNSRSQETVRDTRRALDSVAQAIGSDLGGTFVQATGSPIAREASLEGMNRALLISLPIAVLACLSVAAAMLRSIRYGLASIVPILMVVAWLYAFMKIAGYAINLVTATIAAVSIGIGIDFALHYISRYREELDRWGVRAKAVRIAGEGTGLALVASAVSSAVGFAILAFAPMPLFASYGLLTAIMITMALVATLGVLPSLLVLITADRE